MTMGHIFTLMVLWIDQIVASGVVKCILWWDWRINWSVLFLEDMLQTLLLSEDAERLLLQLNQWLDLEDTWLQHLLHSIDWPPRSYDRNPLDFVWANRENWAYICWNRTALWRTSVKEWYCQWSHGGYLVLNLKLTRLHLWRLETKKILLWIPF